VLWTLSNLFTMPLPKDAAIFQDGVVCSPRVSGFFPRSRSCVQVGFILATTRTAVRASHQLDVDLSKSPPTLSPPLSLACPPADRNRASARAVFQALFCVKNLCKHTPDSMEYDPHLRSAPPASREFAI
jgi:hypothetical protein